jgi:SlyX protein
MSDFDLIIDLQSQVAFQEQSIDALDQVIQKQQHQIDLLTKKFDILQKRFEQIQQEQEIEPFNAFAEKPPHY